jgi:hypothetical protein
MTIRYEETIKGKLQFYKHKDCSVHLTLEKEFRNGITLKINDNNIEFEDEKLGIVIIYLNEIISVDKRQERRW